nr:homeobox protein VENTX isoform X1 [Camelus dromedarius]
MRLLPVGSSRTALQSPRTHHVSVCRVAPRRQTRSGQGRGRGPAQPSASPRSTGVPGLVAPFPEASGAPGTQTRPKRSEATAAPRAGTGDRPQDTPCSSCGTRVKPSRETGGGEGEGPTEPEGPSLTSPSHPVWLVASPTFLRSGATGLQQTGHWPSPRCPGSGHGDLQLPQRIPARPPPSVQRHYPAMPPSSALPGGCKRTSSFGSVDWLSQSSHTGLAHTSRPAEVSWGSLSASAQVYYRGEPHQTVDMEEAKLSEVSAPGTPAAGPSKEADGTRAPRMRTAFTAEQVSALESSFQHRRYLGPLERRRLAQEMQLSEVQVRWPAGRVVACGRPLSDLTLPTGKDLVSEPPNEAQAPAAGLPAESALLRTPPPAPRPAQPPAAALPLGLPAWAPSSGPASGLFLGSPRSETSLPGFSVGLMQQAASGVLPPVCCLPDTGGWVHTLSPALSRGAWGLCAPPATGDAF